MSTENKDIKKIVKKTMENLNKNNIQTFYAETSADVIPIVKSLLNKGDVISSGGSMSLKETGVMDLIKSSDYNYLDRTGLDGDAVQEIYRKSFFADSYLCSSNAITEMGELYNVDGNSNRIACICYGPKSVIMVVGVNKIVPTLDDAVKRVKTIAAPCNTKRLDCKTYCKEKGECMGLSDTSSITTGCSGDARICCNYLISAHQRIKNRIKVIIVNEKLGF